jgi:hypothetical protein
MFRIDIVGATPYDGGFGGVNYTLDETSFL